MPRRYVTREPVPKIVMMPKDRWLNTRTFVTAEGVEMISTWSGKGPLPGSGDWPTGGEKDTTVPAQIHLPNTRGHRS